MSTTLKLYQVADALIGEQWKRREVQTLECVADIAAIDNGKIHFYEIKGSTDRLDRLPAQLNSYSKSGEFVTLVCDNKLCVGARKIIEKSFPWVGLVRVNVCGPELTVVDRIREAKPSEIAVLARTARLLRGYELQAWLEELGVAKGVRGRGRPTQIRRLAEQRIPIESVRERVVKCWPQRDWSLLG